MNPEYIKYKDMIKVLNDSMERIESNIFLIRSNMELLASNPLNRPLKEFTDQMMSFKVELDIQEKLQLELADIRRDLTKKSFIDFAGVFNNQ